MTDARVLAVSVSPIRELDRDGKQWTTAIFKEPQEGPVAVHRLGFEGDDQAAKHVHGGPYRALYAYPHQHYAYWAEHQGLTNWPYGGFGENLTVTHLDEDNMHMGDTLCIGSVLTQVSQPRGPCNTLAMRVGDVHFPKKLAESGRTGFYMRVIEEGEIGAGDAIEIVDRDPRELSVRRCFRLKYFDKDDLEGMKIAAEIEAIEPSWRAWYAERANA